MILDERPSVVLRMVMEVVGRLGFDRERVERIARSHKGSYLSFGPLIDLSRRWESSLERGEPDYGVYLEPDYLGELWICWSIYSRDYLRRLQLRLHEMPPARSIVDVGCGLGLTSAAISELFPKARVLATESDGSPQRMVASALAERSRFTLATLDELEALPDVDGVFMFEYLEHFADPLAHLRRLLALEPAWIVDASTFTSDGIGHFPSYPVGRLVDAIGSSVTQAVRAELRAEGFEPTLRFWNGRPTVWERVGGRG